MTRTQLQLLKSIPTLIIPKSCWDKYYSELFDQRTADLLGWGIHEDADSVQWSIQKFSIGDKVKVISISRRLPHYSPIERTAEEEEYFRKELLMGDQLNLNQIGTVVGIEEDGEYYVEFSTLPGFSNGGDNVWPGENLKLVERAI